MYKDSVFTIGPYQIAFDVTNKCNLRCLHCYNSSGENNVINNELTDQEVLEFVGDLLPMKLLNFCFCGGETLLRKELIYDCVKMLSNCGVRTSIVSNGILASEDVMRKLYQSGLNSIQFSLDGGRSETHNRLRNQSGVFEKVINAINISRKYDMEMSIAFTPTSFNVDEVEMVYSYLSQLTYNNKMELRIQPLMPLGRGNKNIDEICPSEVQYRRLVDTINKLNRTDNSIKIIWGDPIDHLIRFRKLTGMPVYNSSIRANGDIVVSPYIPLVIGNIKKHKFKEYWDGGLCDVWKKKIPNYLASFIQSIKDMQTITSKLPIAFMNDIYIDMLDENLDDINLIDHLIS